MISLKEARDQGRMEEFMAQEAERKADPEAFARVLDAMAKNSPEAEEA